ncbi:MAG TPA: YceI family protein [Polyangiaceae bacterium]|nr:YceI family protein [Polyangiaceae bacterium]
MTVSASPVAAPRTAAQPARWTIDAAHSSVGFSVRHMMISNVRGEFTSFSGQVVYDPRSPESARVSASIDVTSLSTRDAKRDEHLRSADFFNADRYPILTFESRSVVPDGSDRLKVVGDLTIAGTTREVVLEARDITKPQVDPWGKRRIGASARTKLRRSEFGMQWNAALEAGGVLVGDEVTIDIDVSLVSADA